MALKTDEGFLIRLPRKFTFMRGYIDFDYVLAYFDWNLHDVSVQIDLSGCENTNFQVLALLIQYAWHLSSRGCRVTFRYGLASSNLTKMMNAIGAGDWHQILTTDGRDFGYGISKTFALRRRADVQNTINRARNAIRNYAVGFPDYLSYIISELLYNATEHGHREAQVEKSDVIVPAIFQFGKYPFLNRLVFFFSDVGVGVKRHLEQTYDVFPTHQDAIKYALKPNVSGNFRQQSMPYASRNNAGMGLAYSSSMLKRLKGDMYIVSYDGLVHVSPEDVTTKTLQNSWQGTFVLITLDMADAPGVTLEELLGEIRVRAEAEIASADDKEDSSKYYVSIYNYFGKWAEDKDQAIHFRDERLMPAIEDGKRIDLDFRDVETAPHSFLNALLADPVQRLGPKAYQWIRVFNAPGTIHEIIHTVISSNLPEMR